MHFMTCSCNKIMESRLIFGVFACICEILNTRQLFFVLIVWPHSFPTWSSSKPLRLLAIFHPSTWSRRFSAWLCTKNIITRFRILAWSCSFTTSSRCPNFKCLLYFDILTCSCQSLTCTNISHLAYSCSNLAYSCTQRLAYSSHATLTCSGDTSCLCTVEYFFLLYCMIVCLTCQWGYWTIQVWGCVFNCCI